VYSSMSIYVLKKLFYVKNKTVSTDLKKLGSSMSVC